MNNRLNLLLEEIKKIQDLDYLLVDDPERSYNIDIMDQSKNMHHLHKCMYETNRYPFLNEYIHEYLNLCPEKVDVLCDSGYTPLTIAIILGNSKETIKILLEHGANVNHIDESEFSPLFYLISNSDIEDIIGLLIDYGADVKYKLQNGTNILTYLCQRSFPSKHNVKIALKQGIDINAVDGEKLSALMNVCFYGEYNLEGVVRLLLKNGANIHLVSEGAKQH